MQYKLLQLEQSYSAEHTAAIAAAAARNGAGVDKPRSQAHLKRRLVKYETTEELSQGIVHVNYSS